MIIIMIIIIIIIYLLVDSRVGLCYESKCCPSSVGSTRTGMIHTIP